MTTDTLFPRTQRIGILVFPDFEPLDVWGFIEAFSIARFIGTSYAQPPACPFEIVLISNECRPPAWGPSSGPAPAPVRSFNGPRVAPDLFRDEALEQPFYLLMVPGGQGVASLLLGEGQDALGALLDWLRAMDGRVGLLTSVCTGAALLAKTGLLDGRPAATNHQAFGWVAGFGPKVLWDNTSRWVDAGRYVTSAGVSAGTDMAWHLVSRLAGRAVAEAAALAAEYDWHRDPGQPIFYPQQAAVPSGPG
ncbi:DJ-1/PfpI family protein [Paracidovorax anthurii]|uniref:DJ-1/PfpI family protein n=1 Tax=Paracidovorax anthurii TaxID=78229 RepID=A0A328YT62_9BURK|nr:DJ-1/PfpI family protein [Paracidovorax anthurii]RAR77178.1 DJ-1/PfpI family protein [Paracidovorax anthurii]